MICGSLAETIKNAICQFEVRTIRPVAHNEIFVGIVLMELYHFDSGVIHFTHHRVSQLLGGEGFPDSRCSLKYDVHFVTEQGFQNIVAFLSHINLAQEVLFRILCNHRIRLLQRILFPDNIHDEIVLALSQPKKTSIGLYEELHLFQFRCILECLVFYRSG